MHQVFTIIFNGTNTEQLSTLLFFFNELYFPQKRDKHIYCSVVLANAPGVINMPTPRAI